MSKNQIGVRTGMFTAMARGGRTTKRIRYMAGGNYNYAVYNGKKSFNDGDIVDFDLISGIASNVSLNKDRKGKKIGQVRNINRDPR